MSLPSAPAYTFQEYLNTSRSGRAHLWHWALGIGLIISLTALGVFLIANTLGPHVPYTPFFDYLLLLIIFLPLFCVVFLVHHFWHKRKWLRLITAASRFRWGYFWRAIGVLLAFFTLVSFAEYIIVPEDYAELSLQTDWRAYLGFLALTLGLIPFQAASEELFCRGYLTQALGKYIRAPWIIFIITSAIFAGLHAGNPEAAGQAWPYLISIFGFGLAMSALLYFEGGIESAIGAHIANNIFVFGFLGYADPDIPNTALLTLGEPVIGWSDTVLDLILMAVLTGLIILANQRFGRSMPPKNENNGVKAVK